jgi:hypothetical protein
MSNMQMDLQMLISLPLNAIAMYELALQFIFDATPSTSSDYHDLLAALAIMQETNRFTSNSLAQADKRARLREIQKVQGFAQYYLTLQTIPDSLMAHQHACCSSSY